MSSVQCASITDTGTECSNHYSSGGLCLMLFVTHIYIYIYTVYIWNIYAYTEYIFMFSST